jgi:hypothetical protein
MKEKLRGYQISLMASVEPAKGGRGKKGGVREAAREADMPQATARLRKAKVSKNTESCSVSPEPSSAESSPPPTTAASDWHLIPVVARMSVGEVRRLDEFTAANNYKTRSDCIRDAIRRFIGLGEARAA